MKDFSYITNSHPAYIESLYQEFLKNPENIDPDIRKFFEGFDFAISNSGSLNTTPSYATLSGNIDWMKEVNVYRMILGYRNKGHLLANTNPIRPRKDRGANLELAYYHLSEADLDQTFQVGNLIGLGATTLRNILQHLQQ